MITFVRLRRAALSHRTFSLAILSFVLGLGTLSHAQRRDFAGTYQLSNISTSDGSVALTITLTVHNFTGADIHNGGIALYDSTSPRAQPIDAFNSIKLLPSYRDVTVTRKFTVAKSEYARWSRGENPSLKFLLPDGSGGTRIVPIDLRRELTPAALAK